LGVMLLAFQIASSFVSVPDPSPRDTNVALAAAIFANASLAVLALPMPAGSELGPTIRK